MEGIEVAEQGKQEVNFQDNLIRDLVICFFDFIFCNPFHPFHPC